MSQRRPDLETKSPDVIRLGNANKEMMTFNHMRQVREVVMVKTYAIKKRNKMWSRSATVLPTLRFSREFGLVFCGVAFFLKACGWLLFRHVSIDICLFFGLVFCRFMLCRLFFFSIFVALLLFQCTAKRMLGVFLWKFADFRLVFSDLPPWFFI